MMYSMKRAAELLGIPVVTIRAWENRYGVIAPTRSGGGHRLLSEDDLARLRFLKEQIEFNGLKISEAASLLHQHDADSPQRREAKLSAKLPYSGLVDKLYHELIG